MFFLLSSSFAFAVAEICVIKSKPLLHCPSLSKLIPIVREEWQRHTLVFLSVEMIWDWHLAPRLSAQTGGALGLVLQIPFWTIQGLVSLDYGSWSSEAFGKFETVVNPVCPKYCNFFHWIIVAWKPFLPAMRSLKITSWEMHLRTLPSWFLAGRDLCCSGGPLGSVHSTLVSVAHDVLYWPGHCHLDWEMTNSLPVFASSVGFSPLGDGSVLKTWGVLNLGGHVECDRGHCHLRS